MESDFSKANCNTNTVCANKNQYDSSEGFPSTRVLSGLNTGARGSNMDMPQNLDSSMERENRLREVRPIKIFKKGADG